MKELESPIKDQLLQTIELRSEQEKKKELKLLSSLRKIPGHILWEFNETTKQLIPCSFKMQTFEVTGLVTKNDLLKIHDRVDIKENCFYIQALNKKNALKHLKKLGKV